MTANPLRFLKDWLLWPWRRTPDEKETARLKDELRAATRRVLDLEGRLKKRSKEVLGLKVSVDELKERAASSEVQVGIMDAALGKMRAHYDKDIAIAVRQKAAGCENPPPQNKGRQR